MTKKEVIEAVVEELPTEKSAISKLEVEFVIESFCRVAAAELLGGGEVTLYGLGKLKLKATKERKGWNPRTGEALVIPAGRKVVFSPFGNFKDALKG